MTTDIRAALAAPELVELQDLCFDLQEMARHLVDGNPVKDTLTRAATLLQQLSPPVPAVVPVAECPHCGYEGEMARAPQAGQAQP